MPEMHLTQQQLDNAGLVLIVSQEGLIEWSAKRDRKDVVWMLRSIADDIEKGTL